MGNETGTPIGSDYDWRCYTCSRTQTTTRDGARVDLPRGWVIDKAGRCYCAVCKARR